jgi:hypothetical protein
MILSIKKKTNYLLLNPLTAYYSSLEINLFKINQKIYELSLLFF